MAHGKFRAVTTADDGPPRVASLLVPVGAGVLTWLLVLLVGGFLLSRHSLTPLTLVAVPALGVLFVPLYRLRPWRSGFTERVLTLPRSRSTALAVALGLFVLVRLPVVSDLLAPLVGILLFPLRLVPRLLFGAKVFYGARVGEPAGQLLFAFGKLYAELLWLYAVGAFVALVAPGGGD